MNDDARGSTAEFTDPEGAPHRPAAHRRPGAVALYFAYRALAALVLATPVSVLAARLVGRYPRGDAMLFDAGGLMLVEVARLARVAAAPLAAGLGVGAVLTAALGLVPLAVLLVALGRAGRLSAPAVAAAVARALGPLTLLWGAALAAEVTAGALILLPGVKLADSFGAAPRIRDLLEAAVVVVALLAAAAIGVVHDLARVAVVHEECSFYAAASRGLYAARSAPLKAAWAFAWRGLLSVLAIAGALWVTQLIGVATAPRVALSFAAHHAALAVAAFLRASWLAAAIGLVARSAVDSGRS